MKGDSKNRGTWPLAVVNKTYVGRDGVIRGVELKTGKGTLERPVQLLYPLELACDTKPNVVENLNPEATEFRPKRAAAATANALINPRDRRRRVNAEHDQGTLVLVSLTFIININIKVTYVGCCWTVD